ncbi:hypothetical protein H8957_001232 [Semnopithecus entellus]
MRFDQCRLKETPQRRCYRQPRPRPQGPGFQGGLKSPLSSPSSRHLPPCPRHLASPEPGRRSATPKTTRRTNYCSHREAPPLPDAPPPNAGIRGRVDQALGPPPAPAPASPRPRSSSEQPGSADDWKAAAGGEGPGPGLRAAHSPPSRRPRCSRCPLDQAGRNGRPGWAGRGTLCGHRRLVTEGPSPPAVGPAPGGAEEAAERTSPRGRAHPQGTVTTRGTSRKAGLGAGTRRGYWGRSRGQMPLRSLENRRQAGLGAALSSGVLFPRRPRCPSPAPLAHAQRLVRARPVGQAGRHSPPIGCSVVRPRLPRFLELLRDPLRLGFGLVASGVWAVVLPGSFAELLSFPQHPYSAGQPTLAVTGVHLPNLQQTTFRSFLISWCSGNSWIRDFSKLLSPSSPPPPGPNSCPSHPSPCSPCPPPTPLEWAFIKPKPKKPTDLAVTTTPGPGS